VYHRTADAWNNQLRKFDKTIPQNSSIPKEEEIKEEIEEPRKKKEKKKKVVVSEKSSDDEEEEVEEKKPKKKTKPVEPEAEVDMLDMRPVQQPEP
jgi:hypothetical protein